MFRKFSVLEKTIFLQDVIYDIQLLDGKRFGVTNEFA
jgi:hypothetical protein